jgi:mannosylglycoprotein endo-beta-mannosidase
MSPQSPDVTLYDSSYALAPQDGPYGILYEDDWYNIRNSGLQNYSNTPISYQPEVGSVFTPVLRSLKLFLPSESLQPGSIPGYLATSDDVDPMWQYHKYISYVTDDYDHIYAYQSNYKQILTERKEVNRAKDSKLNGCMSAEDFAWTAQLVQYQQYRALVEGFMLHQWKFYSAVILWKSQSPWPALRGALYDYYLDTNGAFWGVRAATRSASLHAQLHPGTLGVSLINRSPKAVTDVRVTVHYTDLHGTRLHTTRLQAPRVAGNSVWNAPTRLQWPITKTNKSVLLFFLSIDETSTTSEDEKEEEIDENKNMSFSLSNFYWLTDPSLGLRKDYSELGWLRKQHTVHVTIEVMNVEYFSCTALLREGSPIALPRAACEPLEDASATCGGAREDEVLYAEFRVTTPRDASAVAFMVRHTLLRMPVTGSTYDDRVLPTFYSANYYVLPSGARVMIAIAARFSRHDTDGIYLETEGWNVPQSRIKLTSS